MKKCLVILLLLCFTPRVLAKSACSYQEEMDYNVKAGNVKVKYEIKEEVVIESTDPDVRVGDGKISYIEIQILNITDDFYVKLINDDESSDDRLFDDKLTITPNSEGIGIYKIYDYTVMHKFTIEVYTSSKTPCPDERYKIYYLTTPRFNSFSNYSACEGIENYSLCNRFVTFTDISIDEFLKRTKDYKAGKIKEEEPEKEKDKKGLLYYLDQYKWYMLGGVAIIGGTVAVIEIKKTKKQRKLGL